MSKATENLQAALARATEIRPKVGGFPVLAEVLRQAGVTRNVWQLPSAQAIYLTKLGPVVELAQPLLAGPVGVPEYDREALIQALRTDQRGESTFPEFLLASWNAGVVSFEVDFAAHQVSYYGAQGETYVEEYPAVEV